MSHRSELPATFPARVDGQLAVMAVTPPLVKWHPAPAEFSAVRLDGRRFDISQIKAMSIIEVGANQVLKVSLPDHDVRIFAHADLIARLHRFLHAAGDDS